MGAVIVNKKPVSVGCNLYKTHPRFASGENGTTLSIHAEVKAILSCPRRQLTGAEIHGYREGRNGLPALAKPCQKCLEIIVESGIKRIHHTIEGGWETIDL